MEKTVTVPDWLYVLLKAGYHNWAVFAAALVAGVIVSFALFLVNKRYSKKQQTELKTRTLHVLLLVSSAVFAGLQYFIPFLQENLVVLQHLPYLGEYAISIYAAANFLYAIRLKKWFVAWTGWAKKETGDTSKPTESPQPLVVPSVPVEDDLA